MSTKQTNEDLSMEYVELSLDLLNKYKEAGYNPLTRTIYLWGEVNEEMSYHFMTSTSMMIDANGVNEPINIVLNSPGGSIYDMFSIVDHMDYLLLVHKIKCNILATGMAMSAGACILTAATGKRRCTKNTSILFHEVQSYSGYSSTSSKEDDLNHIKELQSRMINLLVSRSKKKTTKFWQSVIDRKDKIYYSTEAKNIGVIDEVI